MACRAVGDPTPTYAWYLGDVRVARAGDTSASPVQMADGALQFTDARSDARGTYKCVATNTVGSDMRTVTLSVHSECYLT
jgi:hypothetical protein